jgi:spore coat polysaccharide biosynthesis protein SpsF
MQKVVEFKKRKKLRVVASVEARMGSSRFPGKVLEKIGHQPALQRLFQRLKACRFLDGYILATTTSRKDDILESYAKKNKIPCFRGSEHDVLNRVVNAHRAINSDIIVEVTGDCPLLDPEIIDLGIQTFLENDCDVVTNCRIPSYPQGIDVQIFRRKDLERVEANILDPSVREHVSLYFYENPKLFKILNLIAPHSLQDASLRLQLDYREDLILIREIYKNLEPSYGPCFRLKAILDLLNKKPALKKINKKCREKPLR